MSVTIINDRGRKSLQLAWIDPDTGRQKKRTTKTTDRAEAERLAADLEKALAAAGNGDVLTVGDVQRLCGGVSFNTVRSWATSGRLKAWKIPATTKDNRAPWRFRKCDVYAFMRDHGIPFNGAVEAANASVLALTRQVGFVEALRASMPEGVCIHRASNAVEAGAMLRDFPPLVILQDDTWPDVVFVVKRLSLLAKWPPVIVRVHPVTAASADPGPIAAELAKHVMQGIDRAKKGGAA